MILYHDHDQTRQTASQGSFDVAGLASSEAPLASAGTDGHPSPDRSTLPIEGKQYDTDFNVFEALDATLDWNITGNKM